MLSNPMAAGLTIIGVAETAYALSQSGKADNAAKPFIGVAAGTLCFAMTGVVTNNWLGFLTGLSACCGEVCLEIMKQKEFNALNPSWAEKKDLITAPLRFAIKHRWICSLNETEAE